MISSDGIKFPGSVTAYGQIAGADEPDKALSKHVAAGKSALPDTDILASFSFAALLNEKPELVGSLGKAKDVSTEELMKMGSEAILMLLNGESGKVSIDAVKREIDNSKAERKKVTDERLKTLEEQCEKLREKEKQDKVSKVFKWFKALFSAVAAIATIVVGAVTLNPLMIAGGALLAVSAADNIMSVATDGETTLTGLLSKGLQKFGVPAAVADSIAQMTMTAIAVAGAVMSMNGAAALTGGAQSAMQIFQCVTQVVDFLATAGEQITNIFSVWNDYKISDLQADLKEIEATLLMMRENDQILKEIMETVLKAQEAVVSGVRQILKESSDTMEHVMTGGQISSAPIQA